MLFFVLCRGWKELKVRENQKNRLFFIYFSTFLTLSFCKEKYSIMRLSVASAVVFILARLLTSDAIAIKDLRGTRGKTTAVLPTQTSYIDSNSTTAYPELEKRDARKKAVVNKDWLKDESERLHGTSEEILHPWVRTVYGTVPEVVTPSVIGGVTFAAEPPAIKDGLEPWISIKNDGLPKTITPKLDHGRTKDSYPDVKTYFQTASTITHRQADLQAHNLKEDETVEEVVMIDEDNTYISLSPLMRCTPDFYFKKGVANMISSEPFCAPREHSRMRLGKTYFLTWYTRFFEGADKVKIHYAYILESAHNKGFVKRDLDDVLKPIDNEIEELTGTLDSIGDVHGAFYSSDWLKNDVGFFPIEVQKKWLRGEVYKKVLVTIQPDNVDDDDFNIKDAPGLVLNFQLKESVGKNTKEMRKTQDLAGTNDDVYYVIMSIPTIVIISVFCMYMFTYMNRKQRDLSHIKKPKRSRFGNGGRYNIPLAVTDIKKPKKQS